MVEVIAEKTNYGLHVYAKNDPSCFIDIKYKKDAWICIEYKSDNWDFLKTALIGVFMSVHEPTSITFADLSDRRDVIAIASLALKYKFGISISPEIMEILKKDSKKSLLDFLVWASKVNKIKIGPKKIIEIVNLTPQVPVKEIDLRHNKSHSSKTAIVKLSSKINVTFSETNDIETQLGFIKNSTRLIFSFNKTELDKKEAYISMVLNMLDENGGINSITISATYVPLLKTMLAAVINYKKNHQDLKVIFEPESLSTLDRSDPGFLKKYQQAISNIDASNFKYNIFNIMLLLSKNHKLSEVELKVYMYFFGLHLKSLSTGSLSYFEFNDNLVFNGLGVKNGFSKKEVFKAINSLKKKNIIRIEKRKTSNIFSLNAKGPVLI